MSQFQIDASVVIGTGGYLETNALRLFDLLFRDRLADAHDATQRRVTHLRQIENMAENGRIAVVTSGMDCDCSSWRNRVHYVNATVAEVDRWLDDYYGGAEGPQGHYLEFPSVARDLRESHRDLALEAFEDGHPHVVHYGPSDVRGRIEY